MSNESVDMGEGSRRDEPIHLVDVAFPSLGCAFAIYYLVTIWNIPREAQMSGLFLSTVIFILSAIFLYRFVSRLRRAYVIRVGVTETLGQGALLWQRLGLFALTVGYVALSPLLGFSLGTCLFLAIAFALLGVRSPKRLVGTSVAMALVGYLFFVVLLGARLPQGPVGDALNMGLRSVGLLGGGA